MATHTHTLLKTISYRILNLAMAFAFVKFVTDSYKWAGIISVGDAVLSTFLFYFHERFWIYLDKRNKK